MRDQSGLGRDQRRKRGKWAWFALAAGLCTLLLGIALLNAVPIAIRLAELANRSPAELIRYAKFRLGGHTNLEALALGPLNSLQDSIVRPVNTSGLPDLGKGQRRYALAPVRYSLLGQPLEDATPGTPNTPPSTNERMVHSADELVRAIEGAVAGQTLLLAPGRYTISRKLGTRAGGSREQPITVKAAAPGEVTLEFNAEEGFNVDHPFWIFENLSIRGICAAQKNCEHAFHVVGDARNVVIRNNRMEEFNAHIKVNGLDGKWPDGGLVQFNTLTNSSARVTEGRPMTPIDLVGADRWVYADNLISNFIKADGNQISYGAFMKGAGHNGRMERNLVICTPNSISQPGARIGLSLGGGGTFPAAVCRDKQCVFEHKDGLVANNIVLHCVDEGVDINLSVGALVAHNTLINTSGVVMRRGPASARVYGNLLEGSLRNRDAGSWTLEMNEVAAMANTFEDADRLSLNWRNPPEKIPSIRAVPRDFCDRVRADGTLPGALAISTPCATTSP